MHVVLGGTSQRTTVEATCEPDHMSKVSKLNIPAFVDCLMTTFRVLFLD